MNHAKQQFKYAAMLIAYIKFLNAIQLASSATAATTNPSNAASSTTTTFGADLMQTSSASPTSPTATTSATLAAATATTTSPSHQPNSGTLLIGGIYELSNINFNNNNNNFNFNFNSNNHEDQQQQLEATDNNSYNNNNNNNNSNGIVNHEMMTTVHESTIQFDPALHEHLQYHDQVPQNFQQQQQQQQQQQNQRQQYLHHRSRQKQRQQQHLLASSNTGGVCKCGEHVDLTACIIQCGGGMTTLLPITNDNQQQQSITSSTFVGSALTSPIASSRSSTTSTMIAAPSSTTTTTVPAAATPTTTSSISATTTSTATSTGSGPTGKMNPLDVTFLLYTRYHRDLVHEYLSTTSGGGGGGQQHHHLTALGHNNHVYSQPTTRGMSPPATANSSPPDTTPSEPILSSSASSSSSSPSSSSSSSSAASSSSPLSSSTSPSSLSLSTGVAPSSPSSMYANQQLTTSSLSIAQTSVINPSDSLVSVSDIIDPNEESSLDESHLNSSLPIKIIIHGFGSGGRRPWVTDMVYKLLDYEDVNVIVVDWEKGAALPNYVQAAGNTRIVGHKIATLIKSINAKHGLSGSRYHLIGFSLGAHVAGFAGMEMRNSTSVSRYWISRITGLDPASPLFEGYEANDRLDPSDAQFVDVIHSNGDGVLRGGFGSLQPMGHVDFYPNGGRVQVGCNSVILSALSDIIYGKWQSLCNHRRALNFFMDSFEFNKCRFRSFNCDSYESYLRGDCFDCGPNDEKCSYMGYLANYSKGRGKMYLTTHEDAPFCANQFIIKIVGSKGFKTHWGKVEVTLVTSDGKNESFWLSSMTSSSSSSVQSTPPSQPSTLSISFTSQTSLNNNNNNSPQSISSLAASTSSMSPGGSSSVSSSSPGSLLASSSPSPSPSSSSSSSLNPYLDNNAQNNNNNSGGGGAVSSSTIVQSQRELNQQNMQSLIVAHPKLSDFTQIILRYTKYKGWIYSGDESWPIDKVFITDSDGQVKSFCGHNTILESHITTRLGLESGNCTVVEATQHHHNHHLLLHNHQQHHHQQQQQQHQQSNQHTRSIGANNMPPTVGTNSIGPGGLMSSQSMSAQRQLGVSQLGQMSAIGTGAGAQNPQQQQQHLHSHSHHQQAKQQSLAPMHQGQQHSSSVRTPRLLASIMQSTVAANELREHAVAIQRMLLPHQKQQQQQQQQQFVMSSAGGGATSTTPTGGDGMNQHYQTALSHHMIVF